MINRILVILILFVCFLSSNLVTPAASLEFDIQDLGTLPGFSIVVPHDINNQGTVVGYVRSGSAYKGFLWNKEVGIQLLSQFEEAMGINSNGKGQVVGYQGNNSFIYDIESAIYSNPLPLLPGFYRNYGHDINDSGNVVGNAYGSSVHPVLLSNGVALDLGSLSGFEYAATYGQSINNEGYIVGAGQQSGPLMQAYISNGYAGEMIELPPLAGDQNSQAIYINENGQVVGWSGVHTSTSTTAVLWETSWPNVSDPIEIGALNNYSCNHAFMINNFGKVVGQSYNIDSSQDTTSSAFFWDEQNGIQNLNDLISSNSGWTLLSATGINDSGEIVGIGIVNGENRAFLLTPRPIPEPATMILLGSGLIGLTGVRRRSKK